MRDEDNFRMSECPRGHGSGVWHGVGQHSWSKDKSPEDVGGILSFSDERGFLSQPSCATKDTDPVQQPLQYKDLGVCLVTRSSVSEES